MSISIYWVPFWDNSLYLGGSAKGKIQWGSVLACLTERYGMKARRTASPKNGTMFRNTWVTSHRARSGIQCAALLAQHRLPSWHDLTTPIRKIQRVIFRSLWEGISSPVVAQRVDSPIVRLTADTSNAPHRLRSEDRWKGEMICLHSPAIRQVVLHRHISPRFSNKTKPKAELMKLSFIS